MRKKKFTKIYVSGAFDILHAGHIHLLRRAHQIADLVIVALDTDENIERRKGRKPIFNLDERKKALELSGLADVIDVNDKDKDCKPCILKHKPDFILHGDDWKDQSLMKEMGIDEKFLKENNIQMVYLPYTEGISTSEIIKRIKERINLS